MKKSDIDDLPQIMQEYFKTYLKVTKDRSDKTISEYEYDLRDAFRFIKRDKFNLKIDDYKDVQIKDLDAVFFGSITTQDLYEYLFALNTKAISRARKISALKSFYKYLCNNIKVIQTNPTISLEGPKLEKRLPKYLKLDEAQSLLHAVDGEFEARDKAILILFLNCGLRLSELTNIDISHIRGDTLNVIGKGNKERALHLNDATISAINNYLLERPREGVIDKTALFLSKQKKRISPRMVELLVKRYIAKAGLDTKKYTPHKLRHTAATLMYKYGNADVLVLQQILGHETVATTQIYTHVDNDEVKKAIDNNPLNK